MHLPSFHDHIIPGQVVVTEEYCHDGGLPGFPTLASCIDTVETVQHPGTGELLSRTVRMGPKLAMDGGSHILLSDYGRNRAYREITGAYSWMVDSSGATLELREDRLTGEPVPLFSFNVGEDRRGRSRARIYPNIGNIEYLEDGSGIPTIRHRHTREGRIVFEKLVRIMEAPDGLLLPFFAGVNYDPDLLVYPYLEELVLGYPYDPARMRQAIVPYIYTAPYDPSGPWS